MSVADQITNYNNGLLNAYNAVSSKGGTVPAQKNLVNLPAAINSISGGGTGPTDSNILITGYSNSTKVISGQNFGSTQGTVYLLDRATHTYNSVTVSSWSDTSITLSNAFNLTTLIGSTCFFIKTAKGSNSNKWMLYGDVAVPGYGLVYYRDFSDNQIKQIQMANTTDLATLKGSSNQYGTQVTIHGTTIYKAQIVGVQFANQTYTVPTYFMAYMLSLNQPVVLPAKFTMSTTATYFMRHCYQFDCPVIFQNTTKRVANYFMQDCRSFNQPISFSGMTAIGTYAFTNCYGFNQKIDFTGYTASTIGNYFLQNCYAYNQKIELPSTFSSIPSYFLSSCYSYDQKIDFSSTSIEEIGDHFLYNCYAFNQPIIFPSGIASVGAYFMYQCRAFNQPLDFPDSTFTEILGYFMYNASAFNSPITFGDDIDDISTYFLYGCSSFNQPMPFLSTVTNISNQFLAQCNAFNQPLDLSSVEFIGTQFMYYCHSFQQNLVLPAVITHIGTEFMAYMYNLERITVNCSVYPSDNASFATHSANNFAYLNGVTLYGTYASDWKEALPDLGSSNYRKIIDGTA